MYMKLQKNLQRFRWFIIYFSEYYLYSHL